MKYNVGDRVRIKSIDWYEKNKSNRGYVTFAYEAEVAFAPEMSSFCGKIVTIAQKGYIKDIGFYRLRDDNDSHIWTDEMIECKVEEETKPKFKVGDKVTLDLYPCVVTTVEWKGDSKYVGYVYTVRGTDFGKIVKEDELVFDEKTLPNTSEIIQLIKNDWNNFKDRYDIPDDYHFVDKNGNEINISEIVLEKKKKEYPKTYEECCEVLGIPNSSMVVHYCRSEVDYEVALSRKLFALQKLLICRDAYWKIAGEEMGLGKPWEPDWTIRGYYAIARSYGNVVKTSNYNCDLTFVFPTAEMRDAFKENFDPDIEICKELL